MLNPPPSFKKRVAASNCSLGTHKSINFAILNPSDWDQGSKIGIIIDGKGLDPGTILHLKLVIIPMRVLHTSSFTLSMRRCNMSLNPKMCSSH
jgi:hypothetical protein